MLQSPFHQSPTSRFQRRVVWFMFLVAIGLGGASLLSASTYPYGLLNILTWWSAIGIILATYASFHVPLRWWQRLSLWASAHHIYLPLFLLAIGLGLITAIRQAIRLQFPKAPITIGCCRCCRPHA